VSTALFSRDVLDFLEMLGTHRVRYLVVGGEAVIQYGYARFTADMDIFYEADAANATRLYRALQEFWGGTVPGIDSADVLRGKGKVFQFGRPPNRVDLLNSIDGVGFPAAWKGRKTERFRHRGQLLTVHFIGLEELIRNKRSAGRNKDLDDLRFLIEARRRRIRKPSRQRRLR
jgi:predicted nucleotidyltransferase